MGRTVAIVGYPDVELLDICSVSTTLEMAGQVGADPPYRSRRAAGSAPPRHCARPC